MLLTVCRAVFQIARLRRNGLHAAWSVRLQTTPESELKHGRNCSVGWGSVLAVHRGRLELGDDVILGDYNNIRASETFIELGSRVLVGQFVSIIAANHVIDEHNVPLLNEIDRERIGVTIADDCWLGAHSVILPGVQLGERCVVGAGAVVTRSFAAGSRLVGVPARAL